jgi:hypothetical protein
VGSKGSSLGGTLAGIQAPVSVSSSSGQTFLSVDDSGDSSASHNATLSNGSLTGLGPATISAGAGLLDFFIYGGNCPTSGNSYTLNNPGPFITHIYTGSVNDFVDIQAASNNFTVDGQGGTVDVHGLNVSNLHGNTQFADYVGDFSSGRFSLWVDDTGASGGQNATLSHVGGGVAQNILTGLSPAPIQFAAGVTSLTVAGGSGRNQYTINDIYGTLFPATFLCNSLDTVVVQAFAGPLTIEGAGTVSLGTGTLTPNGGTVSLPPAISDGDFAAPGLAGGTFQYGPTGSPWVFNSAGGVASNGSAFTSLNPYAPSGTQVAFLQSSGSMSQSVSLTPGTYTINFLAAQRAGLNTHGQPNNEQVELLVDGAQVGLVTPASTQYLPYQSQPFTIATAGLHTIEFLGLLPAGSDNTAFFDEVSVLPFVSTLPATSGNWSGYVIQPASQVDAVGGSWVVPAVTAGSTAAGTAAAFSSSSIWVGIDGYGGSTVEQIGTEEKVSNGQASYLAWVEFFGDQSPQGAKGKYYYQSQIPLSVQAGDSIVARVSFLSSTSTTSTFRFDIQDTPANGGAVETWGDTLTTQYVVPQRASGEWIVEANFHNSIESSLANFGTVQFTGAWATVGTVQFTGPINSFPNYPRSVSMSDPAGGGTSPPTPLVVSAWSPYQFVPNSSPNYAVSGTWSSSFSVTYQSSAAGPITALTAASVALNTAVRANGATPAAIDGAGNLDVFAIGSDHAVWMQSQAPSGGWGGWSSLGGWAYSVALGVGPDGTLELFALGSDHAVWTRSQQADGSWGGWSSLSGWSSSLAVGSDASGNPELFTIGSDHAVWTRTQSASGGWGGWSSLGGWSSSLSAFGDAAGNLDLFAIGSDHALNYRSSSAGTWDNWASLGGWVSG